jgi:hypothetical protein
MKRFIDVMPVREKYSKNVCAWITEGPNPNEVCHLWAYESLGQRMEARNGIAQEAAWQEFAAAGRPDLEEMHSTMLFPAGFSPLK